MAIMFSDFQYCSLIHVNSPTCMISLGRIILNHLDGWPTPHLRETFQHSMPATVRQGWMVDCDGYDPKLHWMWKSWMWKSRKYPKIWKCQLKKVDDSFELQHHNRGKRMERLVLQGGNVQKQNVSRISASRAPFLRPVQPESKVFHGMFWVCFHGLGKAGGLQKLEIIYQTMGQICTTLTKLNFGHESCMVYQCLIPGRKWGPF